MNENILSDITRNVLSAWYLDLKYLVELIDEQDLNFDEIYENVEMNFWREFCNINYFIYEALDQVAQKFLTKYDEEFETDEEVREYEIFTNFMDSHVWFKNEDVQSKFEDYF